MSDSKSGPILVDRDLTVQERTLAEWMLLNGKPEAASFLNQLERARVGALCPCGCASINFDVDQKGIQVGPLAVLGDFLFGDGDETGGVFIFEIDGRLAGLEIYSFGQTVPTELPDPELLRPVSCWKPSEG
jgi:hypothetical protein